MTDRLLASAAVATLLCVAVDAQASTTRHVNASGVDDTAAINAAISASSAGDVVYLNSGNYTISSTLNAKTGVAIVGAGQAATSVQFTGSAGTTLVNIGGVSNVEIANFTLNGNNTAGNAVSGWNGSGQYIHGMAIRNLGADAIGIHFSSSVTDSRIVNNQISNIGVNSEWGSGIRMSWGSSRNQVLNNTVDNAGRGGIFGNDGSTDLIIRNNTVTNSGSGGTGLGIEIWNGSDRTLIQGNTVDQWLSVDRSSQVAVRNNVVNGGFIGLELAVGSDVIFSQNTVNPGAQIGISVSGSGNKERILWANNTIKGSTTWGAQLQPDSPGGIKQHYFYNNTFEGATGGPGALYGGQGHGFRFNLNVGSLPNALENLQLVTLDGNTFSGNHQLGLQGADWTGKLTVINNTIINNGAEAVSISSGSPQFGSDLRWEGNTVTGNASNSQPMSNGTFFNDTPSVAIIAPGVVSVGTPVQFELTYAGVDPLTHILWDLGEGLPILTSDASIIYTDPGTYTVGVVVWDLQGRGAYNELEIVVVPEPSAMLLVATLAVLPFRRWRYAR